MKHTINSIRRRFTTFLAFALSLLSISRCSESVIDPEGVTMYGVPSATFIVKGKVTDNSTGKGIPSIQVSMSYNSVTTDSNGSYEITADEFPTDTVSLQLSFKDIDSDKNGKCINRDTTVVFENPEYTGESNGWFQGEAEMECNIILQSKE